MLWEQHCRGRHNRALAVLLLVLGVAGLLLVLNTARVAANPTTVVVPNILAIVEGDSSTSVPFDTGLIK